MATIWVINPSGALTNVDGEDTGNKNAANEKIYAGHPAYGLSLERKEGWREATEEEIYAWAKDQAEQVYLQLRADYIKEKRTPPSRTDEAATIAVAAFYESQGLMVPSAAPAAKEAAPAKPAAEAAKPVVEPLTPPKEPVAAGTARGATAKAQA